MKRRQIILGLFVLAALVALFLWGRHKFQFDSAVFRAQLAQADWIRIAVGAACIYLAYIFRSARWAMLLKHNKQVSPFSLVGTQVIGFTAIALIGRVADPVRPYLVSKKTGLPLANQIAVYIVERLFDMGSMALVFSVAMLSVPDAEIIRAMSHSHIISTLQKSHSPEIAAIFARYSGLALTLVGALFLVAVRLAGPAVAVVFERTLGLVSKKLGHAVGHRIHLFQSGLDTMRSFTDFAITASLSLAMWLLIAFSYFETCRAFVASPELATLSPSHSVLLMIASGGASILQLPVLGWFTQIGIVTVAISGLFGASTEAATACAATLLLVTFLSVIPLGLVWAQFEHVNLRKVTAESEEAEEALPPEPTSVAE